MYRYGIAVPKDLNRAIEFLERAAAKGDGYAKGLLGQLLIHGTSGRFLGGIVHPRRMLRGFSMIGSGIRDALFSRKSTTWEE